MKASDLQVYLFMMLIFLKLQYCRISTLESNSTLSITNAAAGGCAGSINDCDIAVDADPNLFMDVPLRRMLSSGYPLAQNPACPQANEPYFFTCLNKGNPSSGRPSCLTSYDRSCYPQEPR
ncbi:hypothetical protein L6164_007573 [Bauhinia variegata]|uniref:Uncharacterized protein n=1 Tax=Bauhinia variegata TaxID=167791 RepID=A0ACB9PJG3_BAUVA|nr:hypothetical protein L6164_007573 [Bauhinia variegata]